MMPSDSGSSAAVQQYRRCVRLSNSDTLEWKQLSLFTTALITLHLMIEDSQDPIYVKQFGEIVAEDEDIRSWCEDDREECLRRSYALDRKWFGCLSSLMTRKNVIAPMPTFNIEDNVREGI